MHEVPSDLARHFLARLIPDACPVDRAEERQFTAALEEVAEQDRGQTDGPQEQTEPAQRLEGRQVRVLDAMELGEPIGGAHGIRSVIGQAPLDGFAHRRDVGGGRAHQQHAVAFLIREVLEEIRLLGNIETASSKLLTIVLSGQPELADRLNEPGLRQLKQRVALRCTLKPLTLEEAMAYVAGRIRVAGGLPEEVFTANAVSAIHAAARGIPRLINVLCDNALVSGFAAQVKPISSKVVQDVCRDFDLPAAGDVAAAAPRQRPALAADKPAAKPVPASPATDRELFRSVAKPRSKFSFFG